MVVTKLSSKGQLVIPKRVRQALRLKAGMTFAVEIEEGRIILHPVGDSEAINEILDELRQLVGADADAPLLDDLESEHRQELERDQRRGQSFLT